MPTGFTIYNGPSAITGAPIVAILTTRSSNSKTGDIPQVWILDATTEPHTAAKNGEDVSVCGGCRHRTDSDGRRSCYVVTHHGPLSVYRTWKRGRYIDATTDHGWATLASWFARDVPRAVRLGAYGDPSAVHPNVMTALAFLARSNDCTPLGYTHDWRHPRAAHLQSMCMASVDTPDEMNTATARGWRTFRVRTEHEENYIGEVTCPATTPDRATCRSCRRCDGIRPDDSSFVSPHVSVVVHGSGTKHYVNRRDNA